MSYLLTYRTIKISFTLWFFSFNVSIQFKYYNDFRTFCFSTVPDYRNSTVYVYIIKINVLSCNKELDMSIVRSTKLTFSIIGVHQYSEIYIVEKFLCYIVWYINVVQKLFFIQLPLQTDWLRWWCNHSPKGITIRSVPKNIIFVYKKIICLYKVEQIVSSYSLSTRNTGLI